MKFGIKNMARIESKNLATNYFPSLVRTYYENTNASTYLSRNTAATSVKVGLWGEMHLLSLDKQSLITEMDRTTRDVLLREIHGNELQGHGSGEQLQELLKLQENSFLACTTFIHPNHGG